MPISLSGPAAVGSSSPADDVVKQTIGAAQPDKFRQILGKVVGSVGNVVMPGLGTAIGNKISGGSAGMGALSADSMQFLQLQEQMNMESRAFETASNVLKSRHDAAMAAIRNIHV
jgi:hypothetical protein